jgi:hypothetical protein
MLHNLSYINFPSTYLAVVECFDRKKIPTSEHINKFNKKYANDPDFIKMSFSEKEMLSMQCRLFDGLTVAEYKDKMKNNPRYKTTCTVVHHNLSKWKVNILKNDIHRESCKQTYNLDLKLKQSPSLSNNSESKLREDEKQDEKQDEIENLEEDENLEYPLNLCSRYNVTRGYKSVYTYREDDEKIVSFCVYSKYPYNCLKIKGFVNLNLHLLNKEVTSFDKEYDDVSLIKMITNSMSPNRKKNNANDFNGATVLENENTIMENGSNEDMPMKNGSNEDMPMQNEDIKSNETMDLNNEVNLIDSDISLYRTDIENTNTETINTNYDNMTCDTRIVNSIDKIIFDDFIDHNLRQKIETNLHE